MAKKKPRKVQTKPAPRVLTAEDHEFIRQILADVDDDDPRLAYADWLEQQGDRYRAEFIRAQIDAARLGPRSPRRKKAAARAERLLKAHGDEWKFLPPTMDAGFGLYERGFPTQTGCELKSFPKEAAAIWQIAPVTRLDLYDLSAAPWDADFKDSWISPSSYAAVAAMPQLVHVRSLSVCECYIRAKHLKPLLASPHLTNLRELHLSINPLGDAGSRVVAEAPCTAGLTLLDLGEALVGNGGAEALAGSPYLSNLKTLSLYVNNIGEPGGRAIASSRTLANLEHLDLRANKLGNSEAALRRRFGERLGL